MVPPGWNVTEPIHVLVQVIKTIDAVHFAPEEAEDFKLQIKSFADSLRGLQTVLEKLQTIFETDDAQSTPLGSLHGLQAKLDASWDYIRRCEEFSKRFNNISNTQAKFAVRKGQASKWVWHKKRAAHLSAQLEYYIRAVSFELQIENFTQTQTRVISPVLLGKSPLVHPIFDPLPPSGYLGNSPPSPHDHQPVLTPQRLLHSPSTSQNKQATRNPRIAPIDSSERSEGRHALRRRRPTFSETIEETEPFDFATTSQGYSAAQYPQSEFSASTTSQGYSAAQYPQSEFSASTTTHRSSFATTASGLSTVRTSLSMSPSIAPKTTDFDSTSTFQRRSIGAQQPSQQMQDLKRVFITVNRESAVRSEPISAIERRPHQDLEHVDVVFCPAMRTSHRYVLKLRLGRPIIPRTEHPTSQEDQSIYCVKIPDDRLKVEKRPSRRSSTTSSRRSDSISSHIREDETEPRYHESRDKFTQAKILLANPQDNIRLQSLIMGPDITLQVQIPVSKISSNLQKESLLQNIRLFHKHRRQYLVFFANMPEKKNFREFDMMMFNPQKAKSANAIRLALIGTPAKRDVHRTQSAPSQLQDPPNGPRMGLTRDIDGEELRGLQYLDITFDDQQGLETFNREARYHGLMDECSLPELSFHEEPG